MEQVLYGAASAYRIRLRVHAAPDGHRGELLAQTERGSPLEGSTPEAPGYFVALAGAVSLRLQPRPEGLEVRSLRIAAPGSVALVAAVTALPSAPEWLEAQAEYVLFEGDAAAAQRSSLLFVPFRQKAQGGAHGDRVAVDQLIHALGYSVARANARLAALPAPGGVGLVASLQVRVGVRALRVGPSAQVVLALTRGDERPEQFLELTLSTSPDVGADAGSASPGG